MTDKSLKNLVHLFSAFIFALLFTAVVTTKEVFGLSYGVTVALQILVLSV